MVERMVIPVPACMSHVPSDEYNQFIYETHLLSRRQIELMGEMFGKLTESEALAKRREIAALTKEGSAKLSKLCDRNAERMMVCMLDMVKYTQASQRGDSPVTRDQAVLLQESGAFLELMRGEGL